MATLTGVSGNIKADSTPADILDVLGWSINIIHVSAAYASSDTSGWKKRLAGIKDWNGTFSIALDDAFTTALVIGELAELDLYTDGSDKYDGFARIDNITIDVNIDDPAVLTMVYTFNGDGALTGSGV